MSSHFSRRRALQAFSAIASAAAFGCGSSAEEEAEAGEDELNVCFRGMDRAVREYGGPTQFHKYEKFVVLCMENRSFDHYFGHLTIPRALGGEGRERWDGRPGSDPEGKKVDGLTGNEANPDLNGNMIKVFKSMNYAIGDIDHEWEACHEQFSGGTNQGFIKPHQRDLLRLNDNNEATKAICWGYKGPDGKEKCGELADPMAYYNREDTKIFHALMDNYAICDRYFCSVMGPTWPNRFYLNGAVSYGGWRNSDGKANKPLWGGGSKSIFGRLRDKCLSTRTYFQDVPWINGAYPGGVVGRTINTAKIFDNQANTDEWNLYPDVIYDTFETACREGTLPTVSYIDPGFIAVPNDDHPPRDVQAGQTLVAALYVAPKQNRFETNPEFKQLGFRVPMIVVGPYVKKNFVSHVEYDHTSVLSTITKRFNLDAINDRVRAANSFEDCIDENALTRPPADPAAMPRVTVSEFDAHETNYATPGQSELAMAYTGKPYVDKETKKIHTDKFLEAADRLGVANVKA
jgi:phospholipase C